MRNARLTLAVFTVMNFVISMTGTVFNGILDKVSVSLGITVANAGMLNTAYALGAGIGVPIALIAFRKAERTTVLKAALFVTILSTLALIYLQSFAGLLAARLVMGVSVNTYSVLAIATVMSRAEKSRQGRVMAVLIAGNSLGLVIGVPLTRALSSSLDWRGIFWALNIIMIFSLLYFVFTLPKSAPDTRNMNLRDELKHIGNKKVISIIVFALVMFIGSGAYYTYLTPYLLTLFPQAEPFMTAVLFALGLASFIGNMLGGQVSDRIGYAKTMRLGAVLQGIFALCALLSRGSMWASVVFAILWLMSLWFTGLQLNTGVAQETKNKSSLALSISASAIQLGGAIGTSLSALVIPSFGIQCIPYTTLAAGIIIITLRVIPSARHSMTRRFTLAGVTAYHNRRETYEHGKL